MKRDSKDNKGRVGVHAVGLVIEDVLKWIFREHPTSDLGIDGHLEVVARGDQGTGRLIALQIKNRKDYFKKLVRGGYVFRGDLDHLNYWLRHSLPVVVILRNPETTQCYWQVVNSKTVERTKGGWKLLVPKSQVLDESSKRRLMQIADIPIDHQRLASLALAKPWMEMLRDDKRLFLKAEEWINKSSGRGSLTLFTHDVDGKEEVVEEWPFVMFPGSIYVEVFPNLFPWADISVDEELYEQYDRDAYDEECGIWDSEDGRYIMYTEEYDEWHSGMAQIRPYTVDSGEVALFQLELRLNETGKAYLALEKYLTEGRPTKSSGRIGQDYGLGLKSLVRKYGLDAETSD